METRNRAAVVEANGINEQERRVRFTFMTEATCENWFVPEVCLCREDSADITRYKNGVATCLYNHDRDKVIAKIDKVYCEDNRYKAEVIFDKDDFSETIFQKVLSGSLRGVSVGYIPKDVQRVKAGKTFMGRAYEKETDVVTKWELLEVSIVSVPADSDSGVGRQQSVVPQKHNSNEKENKKMEKTENVVATRDFDNELKVAIADEKARAESAMKAEKERVSQIFALCKKYNVENTKTEEFIAENKSVADVTASILELKAAAEQAIKATPNVEVGATSDEKLRKAMVDGMAIRYGVKADGDSTYAHCSCRDIMVELLQRSGEKDARYMNDDNLILKARAMGSGQFLGVIEDFANMAKMKAVQEHGFIYRNFVSHGVNKDFKANHYYELGLGGDPVKMEHESDEFKFQSMKDRTVTTSISTYGKAIRFTREIFINDQLGQVADVIARQAVGFERLKEKMFFDMLANGVTYNTTTNKNLVSTNKDISAAAYDEMYQLMMLQMDTDKKGYIGVAPKYLVAPVNQRIAHKVLLHSSAKIDQNNPAVINPVQGDMILFNTPYLSGTAYYAIGSPAEMAGIEYTTLAGQSGVQSRTIVPSNYLGLEYQMWEDFGFSVLSHRAFVKNPNA